jgi:hypothetical protein
VISDLGWISQVQRIGSDINRLEKASRYLGAKDLLIQSMSQPFIHMNINDTMIHVA